jgi:TPP-dependent pyruvate/acetoin dehydrogenase alpha subunit
MIVAERARRLYRSMLRIRRVEEALAERYAEQEMRCPMHLCIGQEAVAAGVSAALRPRDLVFSNHRAHGHYLAKGGDLTAMIAELYGLSAGCCGGRGGSMHLIDLEVGFMGATPIVGGTVPLAVGAAWAAALRGTGQVVVVYFGDGCFEEGVMHESLNFAVLHRLPVVFVCENNQFSVYTRLAARQPVRPIHAVAQAHGLRTEHADGNDVETVTSIAEAACGRVRAGEGPQFLEFSVYRWREHCGPNFDDQLGYRDASEVSFGQADCPIQAYRERLQARGLASADDLTAWEAELAQEIRSAFDMALASPPPLSGSAAGKVYA